MAVNLLAGVGEDLIKRRLIASAPLKKRHTKTLEPSTRGGDTLSAEHSFIAYTPLFANVKLNIMVHGICVGFSKVRILHYQIFLPKKTKRLSEVPPMNK